MGTLVKVRFKLAWQQYRVGDVIEPPATLRGWLLSNGYAEPLKSEPPAVLTALPARKRKRVSP